MQQPPCRWMCLQSRQSHLSRRGRPCWKRSCSGATRPPRIIAVESANGLIRIYRREGERLITEEEPFEP